MIRILAMFCLLSCTPINAGIVVIGDSTSAGMKSWANLMRDDGINLQLIAMSGRTIRDFSVPRDIKASFNFDTAVYFLGINDAFSKYPVFYVERFMVEQLHLLMVRGFKTIVLIPPNIPHLDPYMNDVRTMMIKYCDQRKHFPKLRCHEIKSWDPELTPDGIHPSDELHYLISEEVKTYLW